MATPVQGDVMAGYDSLIWNGTDASGLAVPSGIYRYRLTNAGTTWRLVLVK